MQYSFLSTKPPAQLFSELISDVLGSFLRAGGSVQGEESLGFPAQTAARELALDKWCKING